MQSGWMARIYDDWWRPALFALSTGFGAPSAAREASLVLERLEGVAGARLDLSCGPGSFTRHLVEAAGRSEGAAPVVAVDLSRAMLAQTARAAPSALRIRADAAELPLADASFGAVVNLAALNLYPEPSRVVAESARVLRPGGRWIASSFIAPRRRGGGRLAADGRRPTGSPRGPTEPGSSRSRRCVSGATCWCGGQAGFATQ